MSLIVKKTKKGRKSHVTIAKTIERPVDVVTLIERPSKTEGLLASTSPSDHEQRFQVLGSWLVVERTNFSMSDQGR
jgi:hypothetical protein